MPGKPQFPFADQIAFSPSVPTPWLGGMVIPISNGAGGPNIAIAHGLNRIPRFSWLLDAWTNTNVKHPIARGSTPWSPQYAYLNLPSTSGGHPILVFFA